MIQSSPPLAIMLDQVRSLYNVGSIFRSADSAGASHVYLSGFTATPLHPKLQKTALFSQHHLPWTHICDPKSAALHIRAQGFHLIALEPEANATSLFNLSFNTPTCLIVGHEEVGISPAVLSVADTIAAIPHFGHKDSLNVAVASGIALYHFARQRLE